MKRFISIILSLIMLLSALVPGAFSAYAENVEIDSECTKIILIGNSYTYYNGLDQMLSKLFEENGKKVMVVSAVKGGMDANLLLSGEISYYCWYNGKRFEKGTGYLKDIVAADFGYLGRGGSWDYAVLQNNSPAESTGMGDVYMLGFLRDSLTDNRNFIINSNYWLSSLDTSRHCEHMAVARAAGCSVIDTRGIFTRYHRVFNNRVWFRDLTTRDSRNHPSVWGTYVFALSVYAKLYGTDVFADSPDGEPCAPYNSDGGDISEFMSVERIRNDDGLYNASITKATAAGLQSLVKDCSNYYIGEQLDGTSGISLPQSGLNESIVYYDAENMPLWDWHKLGNVEYYFENGRIVTDGFYDVDGKTYYFDKYGERFSDWFSYDGVRYYLLSDGSVAKGWLKIKDGEGKTKTFRFTDKGAIVTGLKKIDGKTYYFSKGGDGRLKGEMYCSEWREYTVSGDTRKQYFNKNGVMLKGLKTVKGKTYYFNKEGFMKTHSLVNSKGKTYYVNKKGVVKKSGFVSYCGFRYYVNKNGVVLKKRFFSVGGKTYYADRTGALKKGWLTVNGKTYYFSKLKSKKHPKFTMCTGKCKIDGKVYKFGKSGALKAS